MSLATKDKQNEEKKRTVKLGEFIETLKGYAFKSDWYCDEGVPIVKVSDFAEDTVDTRDLEHISKEKAEEFLKYELNINDVVVQTVGSWPTNPKSVVGNAIRVPEKADGALLNQNAVILEPDQKLNKHYLFYLLNSDQFQEYIVGTAQGAASQASITLESIRNFKFRLPSLKKQKQIASVLSSFDDLIENNKKRIEILEEMAEAIYREWFVNFNYPSKFHPNKSSSSSPSGRGTKGEGPPLKESELGPIPENFEVKKRDEIVERINSREDPTELAHDFPYVGLGNIPEKNIAMKSWGEAQEIKSAKYRFKPFDILFAKLRPYLHKCVFAPIEGIVSTDAFVFQPREEHYYGWALTHLSSEEFVEEANTNTKGTNRPRANWKALKENEVPFPPDHLLKKFNQFVRSATDHMRNSIFRNKTLRQTRDLLLPRLISGEIEV